MPDETPLGRELYALGREIGRQLDAELAADPQRDARLIARTIAAAAAHRAEQAQTGDPMHIDSSIASDALTPDQADHVLLAPCSRTCRRHMRCYRIRLAAVAARAVATAPRVTFHPSRGPNAIDVTTVRGRRAVDLIRACHDMLRSWHAASRWAGSTAGPEEDAAVADALDGVHA